MGCQSSGFQNNMLGKKEFESLLTVSAEAQLKKLSNNKELGKRFDPTSAYHADHLLKISEDYHVQEQHPGN
jgi:hypothetical protein